IAELLEAGMEPAAADPRHGDQVGKANRLVKVVVDILLDPPHNGRRRRSAAAIEPFNMVMRQGGQQQSFEHILGRPHDAGVRSEEHTYELQSIMRISYAV